VAYINSDGADLIDNEIPSPIIKQLQDTKNKKIELANEAQKLMDQVDKGVYEQGIDTECSPGSPGESLLFDIKTMKSPRRDAMKCRAKNTFEKPFTFTIDFKSAKGPVLGQSVQDGEQNYANLTNAWKNTSAELQQQTNANNADILQNSTPAIQEKLQEYQDVVEIKTSASSRFVGSSEPKEVTVSSFRLLKNTKVTLSATGDICLGLME